MNDIGQCDGNVADNSPVEYCTGGTDGETPVSSLFRPRGSLARALYEKQKADEYLSTIDKKQWYQCNLANMPSNISSKFVQLEPDEDTNQFISQSEEKSDSLFVQIWHTIAKAFLSLFMSQTSINGWLRRGSMFVLSYNQFIKLMGKDKDMLEDSLLDLGAGDGAVTSHLAKAYKNVYVTELSSTMQTLLQHRGFHVLPISEWQTKKYHTVACLNLLDRCENPFGMLKEIRGTLEPNGRAVIALVLPLSQYVETGSKNHQPKEFLEITGLTFEDQVESAIHQLFEPLGFEMESWTRVPYLCEGDLNQSFYWLDDAVFILKLK
ncbi:protein-L-histidine N-pros-methyltransferase [Onthophagus taurus]|uniref:protein-L-histidine N-pros-methyltransferase n=1 Tax=Onthophagus taurus TaxID=166361 RepID=UPI0039BE5EAF